MGFRYDGRTELDILCYLFPRLVIVVSSEELPAKHCNRGEGEGVPCVVECRRVLRRTVEAKYETLLSLLSNKFLYKE